MKRLLTVTPVDISELYYFKFNVYVAEEKLTITQQNSFIEVPVNSSNLNINFRFEPYRKTGVYNKGRNLILRYSDDFTSDTVTRINGKVIKSLKEIIIPVYRNKITYMEWTDIFKPNYKIKEHMTMK